MKSENLKTVFKEIRHRERPVEKAYSAYSEFVATTINLNNMDSATHEVTWSDRNGLRGNLDRLTRTLTVPFSNSSSFGAKPFNFSSYHSLNEGELNDLQAATYRGSQLEDFSSFLAGIFAWLFLLSIPMILIVGTTFSVLTCLCFLAFMGSIYSLSTARYRFLPQEFRNISADYWAISSIREVQSKAD
jgi:hypothetical protein